MSKGRTQRYPKGWNEQRVRRLAEHYDNQSEAEQVTEHESAFVKRNETVMIVPTDLVPKIAKLISRKRPA